MRIERPGSPDVGVDLDVHFDSGASRSLLNGDVIVPALGLDVFSGPMQRYESVAGGLIEARIHALEIFHPQLGSFRLEAGISTVSIRRNIFGRDFFNLIQIGFQERHQTFLIRTEP